MGASGPALVMLLASAGAGPDSSAAAARGGSVAVIAVGQEVEATGSLQGALESALAGAPHLQLQPASEIASVLRGQDTATAPDPSARARAAELLAEAKRAFYDDELPAALDRLGAVAALQEQSDRTVTAERVHVLLWRTAVFLSLDDAAAAEREAAAALAISPDLQVDPAVFPPSIRNFVDELRERGIPTVRVAILGLPERATIFVNDRPVGSRFRIPPGRHRLAAAAPGYRGINRAFEVSRDSAITLHLPLAVPPQLEGVLLGAAWQGAAAAESRRHLAGLAESLGVEGLVIAATRGEPARARAFVWWKAAPDRGTSSPVMPATPAGRSELVEWMKARALRPPISPVIAASSPGVEDPAGHTVGTDDSRAPVMPGGRESAHRLMSRRNLGWTAVAASAASFGAGAQAWSAREKSMSNQRHATGQNKSIYDPEIRRFEQTSYAGIGLGVALAGAGAWLVLSDRGASVSVMPEPGGFRVGVAARF